MIQAFLPSLIASGGAIVNNVSIAALAPIPVTPAYSLSKAAAFSLTQSLRMLLAGQGVRVHAVLTGPVDTDMVRDLDIPKASPQSVAQGIFDGVGGPRRTSSPIPCPPPSPTAGRWGRPRRLSARTPLSCSLSPSRPNPSPAKRGTKVRQTSGQPVAGIATAARPSAAAGSTARLTGALAVTLGVAAACWVIAIQRMSGMDMGASARLGPFGSFTVLWLVMMAAMMLPGAAPAAVRRARASGRLLAAPLFAGSYLGVWALAGVVVYALYRPHGTVAAGAAAIVAGIYEFTPLKQRFRRRCRDSARSGFQFGLCCTGSCIGLMAMMVALGVMSITWMAVIAVLVLAQKLLPVKAAVDTPLALMIVGLGIWIVLAPSSVPGLSPPM